MRSKPRSLPAACLLAASLALAATAAHAGDAVPAGLVGTWLAGEIAGKAAAGDTATTLEIRPDGSYGGNGGCNTYRGRLKVENGSIAFAPAAATRKMCAPAVMDREQTFFDTLGTVTSWTLEGGALLLTGKDGAPAIRLAAVRTGTDILIHLPGPHHEVARTAVTYLCGGERRVDVEYVNAGETALAVLSLGEAETVIAANVLSASGARYAGGRYEWWTKGDEATLRDLTADAGAAETACRAAE